MTDNRSIEDKFWNELSDEHSERARILDEIINKKVDMILAKKCNECEVKQRNLLHYREQILNKATYITAMLIFLAGFIYYIACVVMKANVTELWKTEGVILSGIFAIWLWGVFKVQPKQAIMNMFTGSQNNGNNNGG